MSSKKLLNKNSERKMDKDTPARTHREGTGSGAARRPCLRAPSHPPASPSVAPRWPEGLRGLGPGPPPPAVGVSREGPEGLQAWGLRCGRAKALTPLPRGSPWDVSPQGAWLGSGDATVQAPSGLSLWVCKAGNKHTSGGRAVTGTTGTWGTDAEAPRRGDGRS